MSQQALAGRLGITFQQVQKYENSANRVSVSRLLQIAEVMGLPLSAFLPQAGDTEVQKTVVLQEDITQATSIIASLITKRENEIEQLRQVRATLAAAWLRLGCGR